MSIGALSHFGFAEESAAAPGTLVTIAHFLDPSDADIGDTYPLKPVPTMREDRAQIRAIRDIREVKGSFTSPGYFDVMPWFFKWTLGDVTSTQQGATSAYSHEFVPATALPSFSAEVDYDTAGARQAAGCKMDKLTLSATPGEALEVAGEFIGIETSNNAAATVAGLPGIDTIVHFSHAVVKFDGTGDSDVMNFEAVIENSLEPIKTLNGTEFIRRIREGVRKLSISMEMDFIDQTYYNYAMAATWVDIDLVFTSGIEADTGYPYSMTVSFPQVGFSTAESPVTADGVTTQKIECQPLYDSAEAIDVGITVVNSDTAYADVA